MWTSGAFPYHYGSHATYVNPSTTKELKCFHTTMVLTQLSEPQVEGVVPIRFHTTMVLTQQMRSMKSIVNAMRFHTTMVLTQQSSASYLQAICSQFPYHYGSHATWYYHRYRRCNNTFPYHYGSHATYSQRAQSMTEGGSFHTTMVLTQPLLLQRYYTGFGLAESNERKALTRVILSVFWRFVWIRFEKS